MLSLPKFLRKLMAEITKKDILDTLNEFYVKILEPRFDRIEERLDDHDQKFKKRIEDPEKRLKTFS